MKLKTFTNLVLGSAMILGAIGCKHAPPTVTHIPNNTPPPMARRDDGHGLETAMPVTSGDTGVTSATTPSLPGLLPPNTIGHPASDWDRNPDLLKAQTVYFDFDKSAIREGEQSKLAEVASYMKANPAYAVLIEGNCDERGTEEYNRSLGERRSLSGREELVKLGVEASRIDTVTYGEDKPADPGHNEAAWAKNRRDDFVVLTPKNTKLASAAQ